MIAILKSEKRRVKVFAYERYPMNAEKKFIYEGTFHEFGVDYEQLEGSFGNFSTALVELDDGTVINTAIDLIQFTNEEKQDAD